MSNQYLDKFAGLKCAADVLDATRPINKEDKEITEAMAVVKVLRKFTLKHPGRFTIIDLCAGNALVSVIAAHLLPVKKCIAIDIADRPRPYDRVNNFQYLQADIMTPTLPQWLCMQGSSVILVATHPCSYRASRIIDVYNSTPNAVGLVMVPCCSGYYPEKRHLEHTFGGYTSWCLWLWKQLPPNAKFKIDTHILSPKNCILYHSSI